MRHCPADATHLLLPQYVDYRPTCGEFKGHVFRKHMQLQGIGVEHFQRWLGLFEGHARRLFQPEVAEQFLVAA